MSNQGNFIEGAGYTLLAGRGPVRQQAINDSNFEAKPLAIAIDELATELSAANDQHRGQTFDRVLELDDDALLAWFYTASNGPPDLPNSFDAVSGFAFAARSLAAYMPEVGPLATGLDKLRRSPVLAASAKLRLRRPLAGRRKKYEIWDLCLKLSEKSAVELKVPAAILGALIPASYLQGTPVPLHSKDAVRRRPAANVRSMGYISVLSSAQRGPSGQAMSAFGVALRWRSILALGCFMRMLLATCAATTTAVPL